MIELGAEGTCNNRESKYYDKNTGNSRGDPWVQRNTVVKMAQKRALVAGSLMVTSLSCDFTQDEEAVANLQQAVADPGAGPTTRVPDQRAPVKIPAVAKVPAPSSVPQAVEQPVAAKPAGKLCSEKQAKYIFRLCKERNIDIGEMMQSLQNAYGAHVQRFDDLSKGEAHDVIEQMTEGALGNS